MSVSLVVTVTLVLAVIFVNGWTDAPNAIATAISTRALKPRTAIAIAVVGNFLGALIMTLINSQVATTISNIVHFGDAPGSQDSQIALAASLFAIVVWATAAWYFGIPTSESHALVAGLTGSAIALGGLGAVNPDEWAKVLIGLSVSTALGFGSGFGLVRMIERMFRDKRRRKANRLFGRCQVGAAASMAFLHGAQDGQKFMGVFMLVLYYNNLTSRGEQGFAIPIWVIVVCSLIMGLGTSVGGMRIIKAVGMDMVKLEKHQGFAADLGAAACLLGASLTGIPVSTTHTKTTAIMGVGAARRLSLVDWRIVKDMVLTWILTFPGCGLIAYLMAELFLRIF